MSRSGVVSGLAAGVLSVGLLSFGSPAQAAPTVQGQRVQAYRFAAISVNTATAKLGYAAGQSTKKASIDAAQKMCKKGSSPSRCTNVAWVRNGCVAVAFAYKNGAPVRFGGGYGLSAKKAQASAAKTAGPGAKVKLTKCT